MKKLIFLLAGGAALGATAAMANPDRDHGEPMTRAEVEAKVAEHFAKVDANGDGAVVEAEAEAAHAAMKVRFQAKMAERHQAMFARADADNSESLSTAEWEAMHAAHMAKRAERSSEAAAEQAEQAAGQAERHAEMAARHQEMFAQADADSNGEVTEAELHAMHEAHADMGHERHDGGQDGMFARADADGDGRVTLAEAKAPALEMFDRADTNDDGTVSVEERGAARAAMRAEWDAKRGE